MVKHIGILESSPKKGELLRIRRSTPLIHGETDFFWGESLAAFSGKNEAVQFGGLEIAVFSF